jgi:N-acyl-D-amino-acid deacylase
MLFEILDNQIPSSEWSMRRFAILVVLTLAGCAPAVQPAGLAPAEPFDLVIEGGRVVDGTGSAWFHGDVAVRGERIVRITPAGVLRGAPATHRVDARGMVVAPGFIDIQSHSRAALLTGDARVISKVTQGVTTEIMGEGTTNAPANALTLGEANEDGAGGGSALARSFVGEGGFDRWLRAMQSRGASVNLGSFVGGGTIRCYGKGQAMGPATPAELDSMRKAMRWAMEDGAFGIATALIYPPGNFASTEELIEVSRAMAPYGGLYITHLRSEADQVLEAMDEAIRIGREAGVPVEIYHLKAAGQRNWYKADAMLARIEAARATGLDVQANIYPYAAAGTGLSACLPPWASADGKLLDNLRDPEMRARIRAEVLDSVQADWEAFCTLATPEGVLLLGLQRPENQRWIGKRLSEVAAERGTDWVDTVLDLLLAEEQRIGSIYFLMSEENVQLKLRQPWMKFGTDAGGINPATARSLSHPRAYGTFTRILGRYVREEETLSLEEAIRKMTSAVATRLSIQDRGVLREGMYADIVVFDPRTVSDHATYEEPHQLSTGVHHVWVNGTAVVLEGQHTGAKPGRIVRGPGYRDRAVEQ